MIVCETNTDNGIKGVSQSHFGQKCLGIALNKCAIALDIIA